MRTLLAAVTALLLLPAAAQAGGFATAGVLNPPQGVAPGEVWKAEIEILQHGRTPMTDLSPAVIVGNERYEATPVAGRPGVYTANVRFPRSGRVEYRIDDGFTNAEPHLFVANVSETGTAPAAAAANDFPWLPVIGGTLAALLLAAAIAVTLRRRRSALPA